MRPGLRIASIPVLFAIGAPLFSQSLTRGPYLGRTDDHSLTVIWRTTAAADSRVDFALAGDDAPQWRTIQSSEAVITHKVRVDGLLSGALYRYQVLSDDILLGDGTFRAPRDAADT